MYVCKIPVRVMYVLHHRYVFMYVFVYVFMNVFMYVCIHVCIHVCIMYVVYKLNTSAAQRMNIKSRYIDTIPKISPCPPPHPLSAPRLWTYAGITQPRAYLTLFKNEGALSLLSLIGVVASRCDSRTSPSGVLGMKLL